jgi:hypothetical protein
LIALVHHPVDLEIFQEFIGFGAISGEDRRRISAHASTIAAAPTQCCPCESTATAAAPASTAATAHGGSGVCAVRPGAYEDRVDPCSETSRLWLLCHSCADLRNSCSQVSYVSEGRVDPLSAPHCRAAN